MVAIFKISAAARPQFVEDVKKWALAVGGKAEIAPFKRLAVGWASRLGGERVFRGGFAIWAYRQPSRRSTRLRPTQRPPAPRDPPASASSSRQ